MRIPPPDVEVKAVVVEVEATEKYKKNIQNNLLNILYTFAKSRPKFKKWQNFVHVVVECPLEVMDFLKSCL